MKKYILLAACLVATHGNAMKKHSELSPEERARKEQEFEARMHAMRFEQELRTLPGMQRATVEMTECGSFGPVSIDNLHDELTKETPKVSEKKEPRELTAFCSDCNSEEFIKSNVDQGYQVHKFENGLVGFCKPGHEKYLILLAAAHKTTSNNN